MRILVVDNATLFRDGLVKLLSTQPDIAVAGEVQDGWEAVVEARRVKPDLILLNPDVPGNGFEALQQIRRESPNTRFIVFSESTKQGTLLQSFISGAHGYFLKDTPSEDVFKAIRDVMGGKTAISFLLSGRLVKEFLQHGVETEHSTGELTLREQDILKRLGEGSSNRDIARELGLSTSTVRHHIHSILGKVGLRNRVEVALFARNRKLESLSQSSDLRNN